MTQTCQKCNITTSALQKRKAIRAKIITGTSTEELLVIVLQERFTFSFMNQFKKELER